MFTLLYVYLFIKHNENLCFLPHLIWIETCLVRNPLVQCTVVLGSTKNLSWIPLWNTKQLPIFFRVSSSNLSPPPKKKEALCSSVLHGTFNGSKTFPDDVQSHRNSSEVKQQYDVIKHGNRRLYRFAAQSLAGFFPFYSSLCNCLHPAFNLSTPDTFTSPWAFRNFQYLMYIHVQKWRRREAEHTDRDSARHSTGEKRASKQSVSTAEEKQGMVQAFTLLLNADQCQCSASRSQLQLPQGTVAKKKKKKRSWAGKLGNLVTSGLV